MEWTRYTTAGVMLLLGNVPVPLHVGRGEELGGMGLDCIGTRCNAAEILTTSAHTTVKWHSHLTIEMPLALNTTSINSLTEEGLWEAVCMPSGRISIYMYAVFFLQTCFFGRVQYREGSFVSWEWQLYALDFNPVSTP